jgi:hypothetical protein
VISGTQAKVSGATMCYFDISAPPDLEKTLELAGGFSGALESALTGAPSDPAGTGSQAAKSLTDLWGTQWGLPMVRLVGLGLAMGHQEEAWSVLKEGTELTFTPHILPGGARGELEIDVTVYHDDPGLDEQGQGQAQTAQISRVAKHETNTSVYTDTFEVFDLSAFGLTTTHPRADYVVPILGQVPFVGQIFRFPRDARMVHHDSLLVVQATIIPTAMDLGHLYIARRTAKRAAAGPSGPGSPSGGGGAM